MIWKLKLKRLVEQSTNFGTRIAVLLITLAFTGITYAVIVILNMHFLNSLQLTAERSLPTWLAYSLISILLGVSLNAHIHKIRLELAKEFCTDYLSFISDNAFRAAALLAHSSLVILSSTAVFKLISQQNELILGSIEWLDQFELSVIILPILWAISLFLSLLLFSSGRALLRQSFEVITPWLAIDMQKTVIDYQTLHEILLQKAKDAKQDAFRKAEIESSVETLRQHRISA